MNYFRSPCQKVIMFGYCYLVTFIKFLIGLGAILLILTAQVAVAQDLKPITFWSDSSRVVIDGGTEDEIRIKDVIYPVSPDAKILNQNGNTIELMYLSIPCVAEIATEPRMGRKLPIVTRIKVLEVLPDLSLRKNRISSIPE